MIHNTKSRRAHADEHTAHILTSGGRKVKTKNNIILSNLFPRHVHARLQNVPPGVALHPEGVLAEHEQHRRPFHETRRIQRREQLS